MKILLIRKRWDPQTVTVKARGTSIKFIEGFIIISQRGETDQKISFDLAKDQLLVL